MEYSLEQVISFLKHKQIYLIAFPRYSNVIKGCKQFIFYDEDCFFNVQFNLGSYGIDEFECYNEEEFRELLGNLSYETMSEDYFTGYDDIPESLIREARERRETLENVLASFQEETKWLTLPYGVGWYLHYNHLLGWHKLFIRNDKILQLSLLDESSARNEINMVLARNPQAKVENINQFVIVELFRTQKQALKHINSMVPGQVGLIYRDSAYEEAVKIMDGDNFYSLTLRDDRLDRFHETSFRILMEDLVVLLLQEKSPSPFPIPDMLQREIAYRFAGVSDFGYYSHQDYSQEEYQEEYYNEEGYPDQGYPQPEYNHGEWGQ